MYGCPCWKARIGAGLLTWCLYMGFCVQPAGRLLGQPMSGDMSGVIVVWAILTALGLGLFIKGIREALSHADHFRMGSFVWSVGVIALCVTALRDHDYIAALPSVEAANGFRATWLGWMANNCGGSGFLDSGIS
jgi:hypothetical protein